MTNHAKRMDDQQWQRELAESVPDTGPRFETYSIAYDAEAIKLDPETYLIARVDHPARRLGGFAVRRTFTLHPSGVGLYFAEFVLDHIATGRILFKGTEEGCESAAASLETLPIDWTVAIDPARLEKEQTDFCLRAMDAAAHGRSVSWRSVSWRSV